jgi:hypothetical protein
MKGAFDKYRAGQATCCEPGQRVFASKLRAHKARSGHNGMASPWLLCHKQGISWLSSPLIFFPVSRFGSGPFPFLLYPGISDIKTWPFKQDRHWRKNARSDSIACRADGPWFIFEGLPQFKS